jgi:hypothetical protein
LSRKPVEKRKQTEQAQHRDGEDRVTRSIVHRPLDRPGAVAIGPSSQEQAAREIQGERQRGSGRDQEDLLPQGFEVEGAQKAARKETAG